MKNFNIMGAHKKIRFLGGAGGGGVTKKQYIVGNCLKRRHWTVCRFKRGSAKKRRAVFLRWVVTPMHTMASLSFGNFPRKGKFSKKRGITN